LISWELTKPGPPGTAPRQLLAHIPVDAVNREEGGRSSVAEHQLPKLSVEGSIPFARSNLEAIQRLRVRKSRAPVEVEQLLCRRVLRYKKFL
jgi:hypothetical protein